MPEIKLSPEELMAQSTEMASLKSEYEALFSQVTNALNGINDSWSENLSSNFSGKIQSAQKSFASVANMLLNGSTAAKLTSLTFSSGAGLNSILSAIMTDGSYKALTDIRNQVEEGVSIICHDLNEAGVDTETIGAITEKFISGDIEGALQDAYDNGLDWTAEILSNGIEEGSWVDVLNKETGGTLGLDGLEKAFYKNWMGGTLEKAGEIVSDMYSDNPDYGKELRCLGEMAWNFSAGAVIDTAGDQVYNVVSQIPGVGDWYAERGATDAESMLSVGLGEMMYAATGNEEDAAYVRNYYSEHGGIGGGIVDGLTEIGSYVWDKATPVFENAWNSVINKKIAV